MLNTKLISDLILANARDIPDWPLPGIIFKDLSPLLNLEAGLDRVTFALHERLPTSCTKIVAVDARGFVFGSALALKAGLPLVLARKPGKVPPPYTSTSYELEYGSNSLEMGCDLLTSEDKVVVVDDVLATGGTARATADLVDLLGAEVVGFLFVLELGFLEGRLKLPHQCAVESLAVVD